MKNIKRGSLSFAAIVCAIIAVFLLGGLLNRLAKVEAMPSHAVTTELETEMMALSIKDIEGCKKVTTFNIVKGEFLSNVMPEGAVYSHDINDLGQKGTIQILIENLNPMAEDFASEAAAVEHLKVESNYKFSIHIPQIFAANIVYANAQFKNATGEIEGYDFINFMNHPKVTESHESKTEPLTLDLSMNAERRAMAPVPLRNGLLLTIHYEAPEGKVAVLDGDILIGEREAVDALVQRGEMSLYLLQILAIASLAMLIFVTILKRRIEFLPQILYILGIAGLYSAAVIFGSPCRHPYLIAAVRSLSVSLIPLGIALSARKKPVRIVLCALALCLCLLPAGTVARVLQAILLIAGFLLLSYETIMGYKLRPDGFAALIFLGICLFGNTDVSLFSPIFNISILLLILTTYTSIHEFILLEKRNRYLTDNLKAEVERQTESLTRIIGEREDLLRYISHDLRKPIIGIRRMLPDITADQNAAASVENKLDTVENVLGELSKFAKTDYHAEQSCVLSLEKILKKVQDDLASDCIANGVHLKIKPTNFEVFAKPNALFSILSNLIFNALEHSGCDTIEITAERYGKKQCRLTVADNGKGAADTATLFAPYNTSLDTEGNTGLGLYLSKQFALSMGGDLLYLREGNITTFSVILPII